MKILHILRSEPDEHLMTIIEKSSAAAVEIQTTLLYRTDVNYDQLIESVFSCDKVISWW